MPCNKKGKKEKTLNRNKRNRTIVKTLRRNIRRCLLAWSKIWRKIWRKTWRKICGAKYGAKYGSTAEGPAGLNQTSENFHFMNENWKQTFGNVALITGLRDSWYEDFFDDWAYLRRRVREGEKENKIRIVTIREFVRYVTTHKVGENFLFIYYSMKNNALKRPFGNQNLVYRVPCSLLMYRVMASVSSSLFLVPCWCLECSDGCNC